MSIAKDDILTFVNSALKRTETDIDSVIQLVLDDLSEENLLQAEDTTQSLASSGNDADYPTGYKELIEIVLNDGTYDGQPLEVISRVEYLRKMKGVISADYAEPEWVNEFNKKFYFVYPADGTYTVKIYYYKYHAQDVDNIEFGDEFEMALKFGTAFFYACMKGLSRYIAIWGPLYQAKKAAREANKPPRAYVVKG